MPLQQAIQPPHQDHTRAAPEPERTLTTPAGTRPDLAETALTYETVPLQVLPRRGRNPDRADGRGTRAGHDERIAGPGARQPDRVDAGSGRQVLDGPARLGSPRRQRPARPDPSSPEAVRYRRGRIAGRLPGAVRARPARARCAGDGRCRRAGRARSPRELHEPLYRVGQSGLDAERPAHYLHPRARAHRPGQPVGPLGRAGHCPPGRQRDAQAVAARHRRRVRGLPRPIRRQR
jgi:hypothetical protein